MSVVVVPPVQKSVAQEEQARLRHEAIKLLCLYPALARALAEYHVQKLDGILELNFAHGGVATVTSRQVKVYRS